MMRGEVRAYKGRELEEGIEIKWKGSRDREERESGGFYGK